MWGCQHLAKKLCHLSATSFLIIPWNSVELYGVICSQSIGSVHFGVSLVLDSIVNPPVQFILVIGLRNSGFKTLLYLVSSFLFNQSCVYNEESVFFC